MALTVALHVESQLVHGLIVESQSLFALIEAVVAGMGCYRGAVLAVACAQSIHMALVMLTAVTVLNLHHSIKRRLQRLPILPEASL